MSNTIGTIFRLTTFGESHGLCIGGIVDGMPSGIIIDYHYIQSELNRRRPGQNNLTTSRNELDEVEFLSGIFEGKTTGTPIAFIVQNKNQKTTDYNNIKDIFRPSHADYTYYKKYGIRDYRGGGRASARITIARIVAGALAKIVLNKYNITINAFTSQVGNISIEKDYKKQDLSLIEMSPIRCPDPKISKLMEKLIAKVKKEEDTIGGIITCIIKGCPIGIGEPEFDKLHSRLGAAMLSINAAKGFEYGDGFEGCEKRGSEENDKFILSTNNKNETIIKTKTNHSGGIQGGISNGEDIYFRVAFKPIPTILKEQESIDIHYNKDTIKPKGRHDTCVLPRTVPIVEAMAAITLLDMILVNNAYHNTIT